MENYELNNTTYDVLKKIKTPIKRRELIKKLIDELNLPQNVLNNKQPGAELNKLKCEFGKIITTLIKSGDLSQNDADVIIINNKSMNVEEIIDRDTKIKEILFELIKTEKFSKKTIAK